MPDPESKKRWDAENTKLITIKLMRRTDQDVIEYLEGKNKRTLICTAIREYIENHKEEQH